MVTGEEMAVKTLALDLEGTLISNAVSQLPRPGLHGFLTFALSRFDVYLFTAVSAGRTRRIVERLVAEGDVPAGFGAVPVVPWSGPHKDLRFLQALDGSVELASSRLVDDLEAYVLPAQRHLWLPIEGWHAPYPAEDRALRALEAVLRAGGR